MTQLIPVRLGRCYLGGISGWDVWLHWGSLEKNSVMEVLGRWLRSMLGNKDCKKVQQAGLDGLCKVLSQLKCCPGTEMAPQRTSWREVREWGIFLLHLVIGVTCTWEAGTTWSVTPFQEILNCETSAAGPLAVGDTAPWSWGVFLAPHCSPPIYPCTAQIYLLCAERSFYQGAVLLPE